LAPLLVAGLWVLDTHQPDTWPDAAAPWFTQVRALAPATLALDRVTAYTGLTPDLPFGSLLVLFALTACTLATLLAIDVPAVLALSVTLGLATTRSLWSTVSPGHDALPVAVVASAVLAVVWPGGRRMAATVALGVLALSPAAAT
jgi:hypothetical protein